VQQDGCVNEYRHLEEMSEQCQIRIENLSAGFFEVQYIGI